MLVLLALLCSWPALHAASALKAQCDFVPPNDPPSKPYDQTLGTQCDGGDAGPWSQAEAELVAHKFAPILYMHPMEPWRLTDPATYFKNALIYGANYKPSSSASSSPLSFASVLGTSEQDATLGGAALDEQGRSTSRVFFNAYPLGKSRAWVLNYNLFYAWNGCGNMAFTTSWTGTQSTLEFFACPHSVHEADWERISVVVCPDKNPFVPPPSSPKPSSSSGSSSSSSSSSSSGSSSGSNGNPTASESNTAAATAEIYAPLNIAMSAAAMFSTEAAELLQSSKAKQEKRQQLGGRVLGAVLSQHNHDVYLPCLDKRGRATGECEFEVADASQPGQQHLVVYAGLNSHANFAHASNGTVYGALRNDQGQSGGGTAQGQPRVEGALMLDRAAKGPKWVPNAANVVKLPSREEEKEKEKERGGGKGLGGGARTPLGGEERSVRQSTAAAEHQSGKGLGKGGGEDLAALDRAWAFYPGFWGTQSWALPASVTCFAPGLLQAAPCPVESPAWQLLAQTLGLPVLQTKATPNMRPRLELPPKGSPPVTPEYHARGGAKQGPNFRAWTRSWLQPRPTNLWHLPSDNFAFRFFLNGNEDHPLLRCLPGMGMGCWPPPDSIMSDAQQAGVGAMSGLGGQVGVELGAQSAEQHLGLDLGVAGGLPQYLPSQQAFWLRLSEPFVCLAAVPLCLLLLLPWAQGLLATWMGWGDLGGESADTFATGSGSGFSASPSAVSATSAAAAAPAPWAAQMQRGSVCVTLLPQADSDSILSSWGSGGSAKSSSSSGSSSSSRALPLSLLTKNAPLAGLLSTLCGVSVAAGALRYAALGKASLPGASLLIDACVTAMVAAVALLVSVDLDAALQSLRALALRVHAGQPALLKGGKEGVSSSWWKSVKAPLLERVTVVLLVLVLVVVGAQAVMHLVHGTLALFFLPLPLDHRDSVVAVAEDDAVFLQQPGLLQGRGAPPPAPTPFVDGNTSMASTPNLGAILYLRCLLLRWLLEGHATLLVLPCLYFVARRKWLHACLCCRNSQV